MSLCSDIGSPCAGLPSDVSNTWVVMGERKGPWLPAAAAGAVVEAGTAAVGARCPAS